MRCASRAREASPLKRLTLRTRPLSLQQTLPSWPPNATSARWKTHYLVRHSTLIEFGLHFSRTTTVMRSRRRSTSRRARSSAGSWPRSENGSSPSPRATRTRASPTSGRASRTSGKRTARGGAAGKARRRGDDSSGASVEFNSSGPGRGWWIRTSQSALAVLNRAYKIIYGWLL